MSRIPQFLALLDKMKEIHIKKNEDYATEDNPYSNFERAAEIASWFDDPVSKVFATLVGVKLARWAEIENKGGHANNEPLEDTKLDAPVYLTLWASYNAYCESRMPLKVWEHEPLYCKKCLLKIEGVPALAFDHGNPVNYHRECLPNDAIGKPAQVD